MCLLFRYLLFSIFFVNVFGDEDTEKRVVTLDVGEVIGEKYWNGDFFEFYGIPYAKVPKGRDKFKVSFKRMYSFKHLATNLLELM